MSLDGSVDIGGNPLLDHLGAIVIGATNPAEEAKKDDEALVSIQKGKPLEFNRIDSISEGLPNERLPLATREALPSGIVKTPNVVEQNPPSR
jgi:hypothetical protein